MPQLLWSLVTLISQPSLCLLPLQSAKPAVQVPLHTLPEQAAVMWLAEQTMPQPPQLLVLVATFVSQPSLCLLPLQSAKPAVQAPLHTPEAQLWMAMWLLEQTVPQLPQLFGSVLTLTSQPFAVTLSQFENPALQAAMVQVPLAQEDVALGAEHRLPQEPQLLTSLLRLRQVPPQLTWPAVQLMVQTPPWQRPL